MPPSTTDKERERRQQEREQRRMEGLAAERRLAAEREKAGAAEQSEQEAAAETEAANKRQRSGPAAATMVENVNKHINDVNKGGGGAVKDMEDVMSVEEVVEADEQVRDPESSPLHKRKRKDKKGKRDSKKDKSKEKEGETEAGGPSILKPRRFSPAAAAAGARQLHLGEVKMSVAETRRGKWGSHVHKHKRVVMLCSKVCKQDGTEAKMNEFVQAARMLYTHMVKVDQTLLWEPVMVEGVRLWDPQGIPADFTDCGQWIKVSGDAGVFEMRKPRKNDNKNQSRGDEEEDWIDPEVYFQFCVSCDVDPTLILERVSFEWARLGGNRMSVKEIPSFATKAAVTLYRVRNDPNYSVLIPELTRMLEAARDKATEEVPDYFCMQEVPRFQLSMQTPKIQGQNTQLFQGWDYRKQNWRKTLHVVVEAEQVELMQELFSMAKELKVLEKYFGPNARVVMVHDSTKKGKTGEMKADLSKYDMAAVASYSRHHINYQANSRYDGIRGILGVDKRFNIPSVSDPSRVVGTLSLREILYRHINTSEGHPLFMEVHQGEPMGSVDVVVGDYEVAEQMMGMINKNPAAFFFYYLTTVSEMDEQFVRKVVAGSIDPTFVREVANCTWEKETRVLTTPEDAEAEKLTAMEEAAWYKDAYGENVFDLSKKDKGKRFSSAELEDLHAANSVKTASKTQSRYSGSPGVETFVVGQKKGKAPAVGSAQATADEFDGKSREELLAMLRKASISPTKTGSHPKEKRAGVGSGGIDEDSSLSGSSSSSSSSGSDSTSASSDGVKSPTPPLVQGE